jgi:hypothetical protein
MRSVLEINLLASVYVTHKLGKNFISLPMITITHQNNSSSLCLWERFSGDVGLCTIRPPSRPPARRTSERAWYLKPVNTKLWLVIILPYKNVPAWSTIGTRNVKFLPCFIAHWITLIELYLWFAFIKWSQPYVHSSDLGGLTRRPCRRSDNAASIRVWVGIVWT